jgi:hypothetical protein
MLGHAGRVSDVLWVVGAIAAIAGMYWLAFRIEAHHSSRSGRRFITSGQFLDARGEPDGRPVELRGEYLDGGHVEVTRRRGGLTRTRGTYRLVARSPELSRKRAVYVLESSDGDRLTLRIPPSSTTAALFDEHLTS